MSNFLKDRDILKINTMFMEEMQVSAEKYDTYDYCIETRETEGGFIWFIGEIGRRKL